MTKTRKLKEPIVCCMCGEEINNYMDSHNPEPLFKYPDRCCNVCNEKVVLLRIKEMKFVRDMFE